MKHATRGPKVTLGHDRCDVWQRLTERLDPGPQGLPDALTQVEEPHIVRLQLSVLLGGLGLRRLDAFSSGLYFAAEFELELVRFQS